MWKGKTGMDTGAKTGDHKEASDKHISVCTLEKEYGAAYGMICRWVKEYLSDGKTGTG